jgi:hypothetical protein
MKSAVNPATLTRVHAPVDQAKRSLPAPPLDHATADTSGAELSGSDQFELLRRDPGRRALAATVRMHKVTNRLGRDDRGRR